MTKNQENTTAHLESNFSNTHNPAQTFLNAAVDPEQLSFNRDLLAQGNKDDKRRRRIEMSGRAHKKYESCVYLVASLPPCCLKAGNQPTLASTQISASQHFKVSFQKIREARPSSIP